MAPILIHTKPCSKFILIIIILTFSEGVRAKVYIKGTTVSRSGQRYMELDDLKMDFSVKDIQMGIKNVHNGNTIIGTVT